MLCLDRFEDWRFNNSRFRQMQMYVHYYERETMNEGDNPPIGIVLCADKRIPLLNDILPEDETDICIKI